MHDSVVRISRAENGFTVRMNDPEIVKANEARSSDDGVGAAAAPYRDPEKSFVFDDAAQVVEFLSKNLEKAVATDSFGTAFDTAVKEQADD